MCPNSRTSSIVFGKWFGIGRVERVARVTAEEIGKRRMTIKIGYQVANLLVGVESMSDEESWAA